MGLKPLNSACSSLCSGCGGRRTPRLLGRRSTTDGLQDWSILRCARPRPALNPLANHPRCFTCDLINSRRSPSTPQWRQSGSFCSRYLYPRALLALTSPPPPTHSTQSTSSLHSSSSSSSRGGEERGAGEAAALPWRRGRRRGRSLRASCSPRWPRRPSSAWSRPGPAPWRRPAKVRRLVFSPELEIFSCCNGRRKLSMQS